VVKMYVEKSTINGGEEISGEGTYVINKKTSIQEIPYSEIYG